MRLGNLRTRVPLALLALFVVLAATTYSRISSNRLNVETGLLFLSALGVLLLCAADATLILLGRSGAARAKTWLAMVTTILMLIALELALRGLGTYANYHERNGNHDYRSLYRQETPPLHVYPAATQISWKEAEFVHARHTNSLGLSEQEIDLTIPKSAAEYRVIASGDSFTEGVGTAYEATWVKVFEKALSGHTGQPRVNAFNAGIAGSDVCFEYRLLREKLLAFNSDLVIVVINNSDVTDLTIRGGKERFQTNTTKGSSLRAGPTWEWLYAISYIFRHVIHDGLGYNWLLLSEQEAITEERSAIGKIRECMNDFEALAAERQFKVLFAFNPHQYEITAERYYGAFQDLVTGQRQIAETRTIDLLDDYRATNTITKANSGEFLWPNDMHHNPKGYEAMGQAIAWKVIEWHLLDEDGR
jgi:lysophospholipase L1-like esterase